MAARLNSAANVPPRIAMIPAAMMDLDARGVEGMQSFYSRAVNAREGNWDERVVDTSLSFRLKWVK